MSRKSMLIDIYIAGKHHRVPESLTLLGLDLSKLDKNTDVLVIGGGAAGAAAALLSQENGAHVLIATKQRLGDGNTVAARAGIQAADRPDDSPVLHYLDTLGGGHFVNDPDLVEVLVKDAPYVIKWLETLGVSWDKYPDGAMREFFGAGTSRKRLHCVHDHTGLEVMQILRDEIRNRGIQYLEFQPAVELIKDDLGRVAGAILLDLETDKLKIIRAKAVILATGGLGRLHIRGFPTSNYHGATADGLVLAYRSGAKLIHADSVQYHPTGALYPPQMLGFVVTEKLRTLGAQLVNADGEQFVAPLELRDVLTAAIICECKKRRKGVSALRGWSGVWLDSPMIELVKGEGTMLRELPITVRQFRRFGIDICKEPILVYPTLHYQNGGIKIDPRGATSVLGLFAAGEVAGGVHGRNRLIGNSLLDALVFGRRAGKAAAVYAKQIRLGHLTLNHVREWEEQLGQVGAADSRPTSPRLFPNYAKESTCHV